jgi:putative ABC transport system substrate-binding protein
MQDASSALGLRLDVLTAGTDSDIDAAFAAMTRQRIGALVVSADPFLSSRKDRLVALAARHAVPAIYQWRNFVEVGGLMSYGSSNIDAYRQTGVYAGLILKGAKPAELPVLQPSRFELVVNLRTAKTLGITLPQSVLLRADEVIE